MFVAHFQTDNPEEFGRFLRGLLGFQNGTPDAAQPNGIEMRTPLMQLPPPEVGSIDGERFKNVVDTPECDAEGIPWDARIHSCGKTMIKGRWRLKRGVSEEMATTVIAELRAQRGEKVVDGKLVYVHAMNSANHVPGAEGQPPPPTQLDRDPEG